MITVKILPNNRSTPPGKLADAELHFSEGPLVGLRLIGFQPVAEVMVLKE